MVGGAGDSAHGTVSVAEQMQPNFSMILCSALLFALLMLGYVGWRFGGPEVRHAEQAPFVMAGSNSCGCYCDGARSVHRSHRRACELLKKRNRLRSNASSAECRCHWIVVVFERLDCSRRSAAKKIASLILRRDSEYYILALVRAGFDISPMLKKLR